MGKIKGQLEHRKFKEGKSLTRKEAILAQCYVCNGEEASSEDCRGRDCPLYQYQPYRGKRKRENGSFMSPQSKEKGTCRSNDLTLEANCSLKL